METTFDTISRKLQIPRQTGVLDVHNHPPAPGERRDSNRNPLDKNLLGRRREELVNPKHQAVVEAGGGEYVPGMFGPLVLFNSKKTGSTLALPENLLTAEEVARKLLVSDKAFGF